MKTIKKILKFSYYFILIFGGIILFFLGMYILFDAATWLEFWKGIIFSLIGSQIAIIKD